MTNNSLIRYLPEVQLTPGGYVHAATCGGHQSAAGNK